MAVDIFSDEFRQAILKIEHQAELDEIHNLVDTFVDSDFLLRIAKKESQIIIGRRGTGKSHIMLYYSQQLSEEFENRKIIPLYINMQTVFMDIGSSRLPNEDLASYLFNNLLVILTKQLYHFFKKTTQLSFFEKFLSIASSKKQKTVSKILDQIEWIAIYGSPHFTRSHTVQRKKRREKTSASEQLSLLAKLDPSVFNIGLKLSDDIVQTAELENEVERITSGINVLKAHSIIQLFESALDAIEADYLIIFLDQWSDILHRDVQPYFANLIKNVLLSTPKIRVKIAVLPTKCNLFVPSINVGCEPERDIYTAFNLDSELLLNQTQTLPVEFYALVLKRHLGVYYNNILQCSGDDYRDFVNQIFSDVGSFEELIIASGGVVRDFIMIFGHAYEILRQTRNIGKIDRELICKGSARHCTHHKLKKIRTDRHRSKIYNKLLTELIKKRNMTSFLLPFTEASEEVDLLDEERLLHEIPQRVLAPGVRGIYRAYLVDHGIRAMNDMCLMNTSEFMKHSFQIEHSEMNQWINKHSLKGVDFRIHHQVPATHIDCPLCGRGISKGTILYKEYGICPNCKKMVDEAKYHSKSR